MKTHRVTKGQFMDALSAFDLAAQDWGWMADMGVGAAAVSRSEKEYKRAKAEVERLILLTSTRPKPPK